MKRFIIPLVLFIFIFLVLISICDDGKQDPTPTATPTPTPTATPSCQEDPCTWAEEIGIVDPGDSGGVVCCINSEGTIIRSEPCVWRTGYEGLEGEEDIIDCIIEHEQRHQRQDNTFCHLYDNSGGRLASESGYESQNECEAYVAQLYCLRRKIIETLSECGEYAEWTDECLAHITILLIAYNSSQGTGEEYCGFPLPDPPPCTPTPTPTPTPTSTPTSTSDPKQNP